MKNDSSKVAYINASILGTIYTISFYRKDLYLRGEPVDGMCDCYTKEIDISINNDCNKNELIITSRLKEQIQHEVIHAFIKECGIDDNGSVSSRWTVDEECIQFFASQFYKLDAIFKDIYMKLEKIINKTN